MLLARVVVEFGHHLLMAAGCKALADARGAHCAQRMSVLASRVAAGLILAAALAREEPAAGREEGLDRGGINGDDSDKLKRH